MDACCIRCLHQRRTLRRTAKSCGPGAATLASIRPACSGTATVTTKAASPGSTKETVKPLRGESRDLLAEPVVNKSCAFVSRTGIRVELARGITHAFRGG